MVRLIDLAQATASGLLYRILYMLSFCYGINETKRCVFFQLLFWNVTLPFLFCFAFLRGPFKQRQQNNPFVSRLPEKLTPQQKVQNTEWKGIVVVVVVVPFLFSICLLPHFSLSSMFRYSSVVFFIFRTLPLPSIVHIKIPWKFSFAKKLITFVIVSWYHFTISSISFTILRFLFLSLFLHWPNPIKFELFSWIFRGKHFVWISFGYFVSFSNNLTILTEIFLSYFLSFVFYFYN